MSSESTLAITTVTVIHTSLLKRLLDERVPSVRDPRLRGKVILHVKQTIIIYKQKIIIHVIIMCYVYVSLLICMGLCLITMNFRLFNAYKRYKVTKVKDGNSAIN